MHLLSIHYIELPMHTSDKSRLTKFTWLRSIPRVVDIGSVASSGCHSSIGLLLPIRRGASCLWDLADLNLSSTFVSILQLNYLDFADVYIKKKLVQLGWFFRNEARYVSTHYTTFDGLSKERCFGSGPSAKGWKQRHIWGFYNQRQQLVRTWILVSYVSY